MHLKIQNDIVRKNVEIFKIILKRATQAHEESRTDNVMQHFKAFVHRSRGEIRFSDFNAEQLDTREWTLVSFQFSLHETPEESFSIDITDIDAHSFSWSTFNPEAFSTLKETLKTIQFIARFLPRLKSLSALFREFSLMNLDTFLDQLTTKDLIHESWHSLNRLECEKLLLIHPPGMFLFRKDEFASLLEEQLSQEHKIQIQCITLSYVSSLKKISDLTLVKRAKGWVVYNNDPCLEGSLYPSIRSLFESLRGILKTPLLHSDTNTKEVPSTG